ncbi:DMT family transporter [Pseudaeromonas sharmana]|uniref:DMT family transporter n=1 Tax=Pseudaeromonas sharmana TaxID=328412 RepID=A0ABV8CPU3_9GAMM
MHPWLLLGIAIGSEVLATSALPASHGFTRPLPSLVVLLGYSVAFYCLSLVLKDLPVGVVYAIWSGAGIVLVSLIGWLFYQQNIDLPTLLGISLITTGVLVLNLFSNSLRH